MKGKGTKAVRPRRRFELWGAAGVIPAAFAVVSFACGGFAVSAQTSQTSASSQTTAPPPAAAPQAPSAPQQPFDEWLAALEKDALAQGIKQSTLDLALANVTPDADVVSHDRAQPEQVQTLDDYLTARLSVKTRDAAVTNARAHSALLAKLTETYGVPSSIMVAIWGLESNFGQVTGTHPIINSLVTLAYDARRPALFRTELLRALEIVDKGLARPEDLKGSWAGAMGQPQFMPSSFLKYAVDFDGDGRANIWTSVDDVLASMANYLKMQGWIAGQRWGREVVVTPEVLATIDKNVPLRTTGCKARKEMTDPRPLDDWAEMGVTLPGGDAKPTGVIAASLVRGEHRYFLAYHNYEALIDYNCANSYALAVGLLADVVEGR